MLAWRRNTQPVGLAPRVRLSSRRMTGTRTGGLKSMRTLQTATRACVITRGVRRRHNAAAARSSQVVIQRRRVGTTRVGRARARLLLVLLVTASVAARRRRRCCRRRRHGGGGDRSARKSSTGQVCLRCCCWGGQADCDGASDVGERWRKSKRSFAGSGGEKEISAVYMKQAAIMTAAKQ